MDNNILAHYGVLGMKWGVRRYQNKDGSLTSSGKKRYGGNDKQASEESPETSRKEKSKKIAKGVAIGSAAVAGTVLAAYLVKKYGHKSVPDMASTAESGKAALDKILKNTEIASTPISQVSTPKVEPKKLVEEAIKSTSTAQVPRTQIPTVQVPRTQIPTTQIPRTQVSRAKIDIPQTYDFETLMKQNQALLEKMYDELT